ncbi:MAG: hypothetical protein HY701_09670 [Gemmatimonadetes bacterium]|nr:hypothetical protein [Gemmatimonadota bacterium]
MAPSAAPAEAPVLAECHPTLAFMTPPQRALEFFAAGQSTSDPRFRRQLETANWYGNEAMWVILPRDGVIEGWLSFKLPPYRFERGIVYYKARRLDGPENVSRRLLGPQHYGDLGFQAGGPTLPTTGCWEVTYMLDDGRDSLRFIIRVR